MRKLAELLSDLFTETEFRRVLEEHAGLRTVADLPTGSSRRMFIRESLDALRRRDLIDEPFFDLLREHRPRAVGRIRSVEAEISGDRDSEFTYDCFISHGQTETREARELARLLNDEGLSVFLDMLSLRAGDLWSDAIREAINKSRIVIFLLSQQSRKDRSFQNAEIEYAVEASRRRPRGIRIVPVILSPFPERIPPALESYHAIIASDEGGLPDAARRLTELARETEPSRSVFQYVREVFGLEKSRDIAETFGDTQLRDLAQRFFRAAGRSPIVRGPNELDVPEPALVAADIPPSPTDVRSLARLLAPGQVGYFLYKEALPENTLLALDSLRVRGNPIVPLAANAMTAALADGTARAMLGQLDSDYRSRDNFFETRNALIDERFFFGRHDLLAQVGSALSRGEHILVFGLRKAGKTSLLNILRQHLPNHPFFIADLQKYDRHEEDWPPFLFRHLVQAFDQWGSAKFNDWPTTTTTLHSATELEDALMMRRRWQLDRGRDERLVVVLDEIERVFPSNDEDGPARKFIRGAGALRSLGQSGADRFISIIAADLRPEANRINRLGSAGTNPFFNFFQEVPLPLLSREAVDEMITSIGRAMGITAVEEEFLNRVFDLGGGHPFVSRLLAGAAYRCRSGDRATLSATDLDSGLDDLYECDTLGSFFRENLWGELRERERALLVDHLLERVSSRNGDEAERAFLGALGLLDHGTIAIRLFAEWVIEKARHGSANP